MLRADGHGSGSDRIDVTDHEGRTIGWVDLASGDRHLLDPAHATDFDDLVDYWLDAAGLAVAAQGTDPTVAGGRGTGRPATPPNHPSRRFRVTEVRFPDPEVVRTLVAPLRQAAS
jgi:hypothetical protein